MGLWVSKIVKCFNYGLIGCIRNIEDGDAEGYLNFRGLDQEVSEEKNFSRWPRDCSCDNLAKKVTAFCPWLKSLPEARLKNLILITSAQEISKQSSIDSICAY